MSTKVKKIQLESEIKIREEKHRAAWVLAIAFFVIFLVLALLSALTEYGGTKRAFTENAWFLSWTDFIVLGIVSLCGIPAFYIYGREASRRRKIDENLPYLLRQIADAQRTGMSLPRAVIEASKRQYGPLTKELIKMAAKISWGITFAEAMREFARACDTATVKRATILILEAERSGGNLREIFDSAYEHVAEILALRKEREGQMKPYIYIIYAAFMIFVGIIVILFKTFFVEMSDLSSGTDGGLTQESIDLDLYKLLFLHLLVIEGFFSGIIAGKMGENSGKLGLRHSTILIGVGWVIFKLVI